MKPCILILIFISNFFVSPAQVPKVATGSIRHFEKFSSKYITDRNVDVWLPEVYSAQKKYAVLYMHDGKALFDADIMWNHQEWGVDEVLGRLMKENKINDCIVVGVWNSESTRHNDYLPQKPFASLSTARQEVILKAARPGGQAVFSSYQVQSDNYLRFLVQELKPFIDSSFSTRPDQQNTFVAGSSMGGLISIYAICEYPDVFRGAACLSTHWPGIFRFDHNPFPGVMIKYLGKNLPTSRDHKVYFDYGTETPDSMYKPFQLLVDRKMKRKGFDSNNWMTSEHKGADHSERSWNKRLEMPILFLLGK